MVKVQNYNDLVRMSSTIFEQYLIEKISVNINTDNIDSVEGVTYLGRVLMDISARVSELSCAMVFIRNAKRLADRVGTKDDYQDLIDKEKNLDTCIKALETTYKAVNRNILIREENNKELYMTGA